MTVYFDKRRGAYRWSFEFHRQRHQSPRTFPTKREAKAAEEVRRTSLRRQRAGLEAPPTERAPTFSEWAGVYMTYVERLAKDGHIKRPDIIDGNLRVVLRFWGKRPRKKATIEAGAPYHNLRLDDPILTPKWLREFDTWIDQRKVKPWTRHHYLVTMSRLYWLALHPEYRQDAGTIAYNPFAGRPRPRGARRTVTVTPGELLRWLTAASYHVRLAMAIAALAPKLRLQNILQLQWADVDLERNLIVIWRHKSDRSGRPMVSAISPPLRTILHHARAQYPYADHVVLYRGKPVQKIDTAVKAAALAAEIRYGRDVGGATFHTLRHSMSTLLARLGRKPLELQMAMGHADYATTTRYTHLDVEDERTALDALGERLAIEEVVMAGPRRQRRKRVG